MIQSRIYLGALALFAYVLCKWKPYLFLVSLKQITVRSNDVQWLCGGNILDYDDYGTENIKPYRN